jgi:hypothetical protein
MSNNGKTYTVMYVRTFVDSHGVKREHFRHIGQAFKPKDPNEEGFDALIFEIPPPDIQVKEIDGGENVIEQRWRLMIRVKREKPDEPEVQTRRKFGGG